MVLYKADGIAYARSLAQAVQQRSVPAVTRPVFWQNVFDSAKRRPLGTSKALSHSTLELILKPDERAELEQLSRVAMRLSTWDQFGAPQSQDNLRALSEEVRRGKRPAATREEAFQIALPRISTNVPGLLEGLCCFIFSQMHWKLDRLLAMATTTPPPRPKPQPPAERQNRSERMSARLMDEQALRKLLATTFPECRADISLAMTRVRDLSPGKIYGFRRTHDSTTHPRELLVGIGRGGPIVIFSQDRALVNGIEQPVLAVQISNESVAPIAGTNECGHYLPPSRGTAWQ